MINDNRTLCYKRQKQTDISSCIFCRSYRTGRCSAPEVNILRQNNKGGYELYYPLQKQFERILKTFMISTKDILIDLEKKFNISMPRTSLFDYGRKGLIEKVEKIGKGNKKGVETYWADNSLVYIFVVKELMNFKSVTGRDLTIKEIKKYFDILKFKENIDFKKLTEDFNLLEKVKKLIDEMRKNIVFKSEEESMIIGSVLSEIDQIDRFREINELGNIASRFAFAKLCEQGYLKSIYQDDGYILNYSYNFDIGDESVMVEFNFPLKINVFFKKSGVEIEGSGKKVSMEEYFTSFSHNEDINN